MANGTMVTSMITMNLGDNRYCYLITFNVYQCRAKKRATELLGVVGMHTRS